ncbi:D111/G-patch domain-containing protein [Carex rostrata]
MLGGLYGDLPPPSSSADEEKTTTSSVWSSSTKMAPPTLRKPSTILAPPHSLRPKPLVQSQPKTTIVQPVLLETTPHPTSYQPALVGVTSSVIDEYDPARPNDYEDYRREKKRLAAEAERKREVERRRREEEERERDREREREREKERERESQNISGEEAWRRRAAMGGRKEREKSPEREREREKKGAQMTAAQRMMAKMGWKEGQGLGKQEQGITTPLMAKKTDRRAGVIVNASESKKPKSASFEGVPTRVIMLRNMVGPGEVDDELEDEVASECAKYGTVTRVLIFEITETNFPSEEAVRIFIQFERSEEATKALVDLEGRFFGGRIVRATFFDEERFGRNDLAPAAGEVPGFF